MTFYTSTYGSTASEDEMLRRREANERANRIQDALQRPAVLIEQHPGWGSTAPGMEHVRCALPEDWGFI